MRRGKEPWSQFLSGTAGCVAGLRSARVRDLRGARARARTARLVQSVSRGDPCRCESSRRITSRANIPSGRGGTRGQLWLDPGEPAARDYVISVMVDVARRYDVDGIHIDDYFYPYPKGGASFPDNATYAKYGGGTEPRRLAARQHQPLRGDDVLAGEVGAPIGENRHQSFRHLASRRAARGSRPTVDSYAQFFSDSRKWLAEGWCDYLAPQLYWPISPAKQSFPSAAELVALRRATGKADVARSSRTERIGAVAACAGNHRANRADAARDEFARPHPLEHEGADEESGRDRGPVARGALCGKGG